MKLKVKALITITMMVSLAITGCGKEAKVSDSDTLYSTYQTLSDEEKAEKRDNSTYINEVNYQGEDVPYYLFETPFQITGDEDNAEPSAYVANRDLTISDKAYEKYVEVLEKKINTIFNMSYRDIISNQDAFIENYIDGNTTEESENNAYAIEELYVDHKLTTTADVTTGKCLLYEDMGMYILRASIDIRIAGDETVEEAFEDVFNITLNEGATTVMAEAFFYKDTSYKIGMLTMQNIEE